MTQVTLPDSLQTIDIHAFYGCDRLAQISLSSSFCFIENYEFRTYDDILEDDIVIPGLVVTVAPASTLSNTAGSRESRMNMQSEADIHCPRRGCGAAREIT